MERLLRLSVALLLLLALFGCKKKAGAAEEEIRSAESVSETNFIPEQKEEGDSTAASDNPSSDDTAASEPASPVPAPPVFSSKTSASSSSDSADRNLSSGDRIDDMFIYKMTLKRVVPEDYLIGPLENLQNTDYRVSQILKTLNTFFRDLRIGTLNEDCIHPSAVLLLSSSFGFYLEEEAVPDVVRIGKVEITGKSARVNMRFYRGNGVTDGEMILEETTVDKTKKWLITDCQADLMQILDPYKPSAEPFQPGAYNFYNWE